MKPQDDPNNNFHAPTLSETADLLRSGDCKTMEKLIFRKHCTFLALCDMDPYKGTVAAKFWMHPRPVQVAITKGADRHLECVKSLTWSSRENRVEFCDQNLKITQFTPPMHQNGPSVLSPGNQIHRIKIRVSAWTTARQADGVRPRRFPGSLSPGFGLSGGSASSRLDHGFHIP